MTTLPLSCATVMKSWNLNFLEPSGSPQACNGTALPKRVRVLDFFAVVILLFCGMCVIVLSCIVVHCHQI